MRVTCEDCGKVYDDALRWTICPHPELGTPAPAFTRTRTIGDAPADGPETVEGTGTHPQKRE